MLNIHIHDYKDGSYLPFITCSCCGSIIENLFGVCATYPLNFRRVNDYSPAIQLIPLDHTPIFVTHSDICVDMAHEKAGILWGENFAHENLGDFVLQMLLNTTDVDLLLEKRALLIGDDEEEDAEEEEDS